LSTPRKTYTRRFYEDGEPRGYEMETHFTCEECGAKAVLDKFGRLVCPNGHSLPMQTRESYQKEGE